MAKLSKRVIHLQASNKLDTDKPTAQTDSITKQRKHTFGYKRDDTTSSSVTSPRTFPHFPSCSAALTAAKSAGGSAALGLVVSGCLSPRTALVTCGGTRYGQIMLQQYE